MKHLSEHVMSSLHRFSRPSRLGVSTVGVERTAISAIVGTARGFTFVCWRHQFASRTVEDLQNLTQACPICEAEADASLGRDRYRALHAVLTA